jgi:Mg2+/Co2+ transporter CorB
LDAVPLWAQLTALAVLILLSAFFAITETALMTANRHRLRHLARRGSRSAATALWLLERTDGLLALVLIGSTMANALATALATLIAITLYGGQESKLVITVAVVSLLLIVFAQIAPKVIGAAHPDRITLATSLMLRLLMTVAAPLIWVIHMLVSGLMWLLRLRSGADDARLSTEELRSMVLESGSFIPGKHRSILLNLFELEKISVEDVMTPRAQIESLNLAVPVAEIRHQLTTCYHNQLPVHEGEINDISGILHVRKAMALLADEDLTTADFRELLSAPYFIPPDTDVFTQLQYFQENHERLAIIVDEYGEVQGLVTLDDIIEEMVGEFTTPAPGAARADLPGWDKNGECLVEGSALLRDLNKRLGMDFPLDGPKTINGLLLEYLQDIPEAHVSVKLAGCVIEIVQAQNQAIKVVKLIRPGKRKVSVDKL